MRFLPILLVVTILGACAKPAVIKNLQAGRTEVGVTRHWTQSMADVREMAATACEKHGAKPRLLSSEDRNPGDPLGERYYLFACVKN